jgi:spectinomycin phosphotransferase
MKEISEIIASEYGISVSSIEHLNIGFDGNTMVYKLHSFDEKKYFLKIRTQNFTESSLNIPVWLSKNNWFKNIINPVETIDKKLYVEKSSQYMIVFPYINGHSGGDVPLTKDQFIEFGKFMNYLHTTKYPEEQLNSIPIEEYNQKYRKMVKKYLGNIKEKVHSDPIILEFLDTLEINRNTIIGLLNFLNMAVNEISHSRQNLCLCHGDIHANNIFIDENDFYIVDWDTIIMAPKEKDLMFIGGGVGGKWNSEEEVINFYKGYGQNTKIDNELLKYYRCERIIQDIYEFYHEIIGSKYDMEKRKLCLKHFKSQFEPKNVVEIGLNT